MKRAPNDTGKESPKRLRTECVSVSGTETPVAEIVSKSGVMIQIYNSALQKLRQEDCCKFEANRL